MDRFGRDRPLPAADGAEDEQLEALLSDAHGRGDEGDFEGMAETLRDGLELRPADPTVLCWLGVAEREMGLEGVAYERFRQCLAADPEDPFVLAMAGTALAAFDDPDAEPALRAAAMLGPDMPLARWMYGAFLTREGMVQEGIRELEAARDLAPDAAVVAYELGVGRVLAGDVQQGVEELARAVDLEPADGWVRIVLGLALLESGEPEAAARELEAGARLHEDDVEAQLLAALALGALGADDSAWEMLERARMYAVGTDRSLVVAVEERLQEGAAEAEALLAKDLAPSAFRERLHERP